LNICKLPGMSSHDVVYRVRKVVEVKRVGHTGTLDPAACGVLPICVGPVTRLADYINAGPKSYRAEIMLGVTTRGDDAEGDVATVCDAGHLDDTAIRAAMASFTGTITQRPPAQSAVWIDGQRAYHMARAGQEITMPEREVTVHEFTLVRLLPGAHPRVLADITVSKGTYIRALARDLGAALGVGGTLSFLARTQVGLCRLEDAITVNELAEATARGELSRWLRPADEALPHLPAVDADVSYRAYRHGTLVDVAVDDGLYRVYVEGHFAGLGQVTEGVLRPTVNILAC